MDLFNKIILKSISVRKSATNYFYIFSLVAFFLSCKTKQYQIDSESVVCNEVTYKTYKYDDLVYNDVIISKCIYKNYLFESIGIPDYIGRYSYEYNIYKIAYKDTVQVKNSDFFKNYKQLEKKINQRLEADLGEDAKHDELKRCVESIDFKYYDFNEFGIFFRNNNLIQFHINYGLSMVCAPVAIGLVEFNIDEVEKYIN